ncbi:MAG: B12-binding domain-containing radical SAM protein [Promethearchaeota archaeon]
MLKENAIIKDWRNIDLSFGLIYPNVYQIGMSSYSLRLIYFIINSYNNFVCERIFLPDKIRYPASEDYSSENQLRSIENKVDPKDFDILGFSIQFENDFKNILWILEKAEIPIERKKRQEFSNNGNKLFPLIIGGGPVATSNPIPFSRFFDLFFIGDSEPNLEEVLKILLNHKNNGLSYHQFLNSIKHIEGIYIPSLNNKVKRSVLSDLDKSPIPNIQLISETSKEKKIFEQNFFIEVNRGCPYICKFCISSFHNSPFRNRSFKNITQSIENGLKYSMINKISLIGSCVSAHPKFLEICEFILKKGMKFSIPSIRIDHLNEDILKLLELNKTQTITIAPETGTENLRFALGKRISNEKIYTTVDLIRKSSIRNIKFYFLIGLPNETEEDIEILIKTLNEFSNMGFEKGALKVNINILIPKLNTPYETQIEHLTDEKINNLKFSYQRIERKLKHNPAIKLKFQKFNDLIKQARLQALISLGNMEVSSLLTNYYLEGANFGALRKAERQWDSTINDYFKNIINGYIPWKVWEFKKKEN